MVSWKFWTIYAVGIATMIGGIKACDNAVYNKIEKTDKYTFVSEGNFLGIKEYTRYDDGHQELRKTGPVFAQMNDFYIDKNGDGLADIIKEASAWSVTRTEDILIRDRDYNSNKELFDDADKDIQHYMNTYK